MGVDWLTCNSCEDTFPDCGDFVSCGDDCGIDWCSQECAEEDGFQYASCKLGLELSSEGFLEDDNSKCSRYKDSDEQYMDCDGCENYMPTSCKYCRHEDYGDSELLEKAMELLECDRDFLIRRKNNGRN